MKPLSSIVALAFLFIPALPASGQMVVRRAIYSSSPFTPSDLSGLHLWLKADDISGSDGVAVASWPDASGNSNNATQDAGGAQPVKKTAIVNSFSVVRFGSGQGLTLPSFASLTAGEAFVVCRSSDLGSFNGLWSFGTSGVASHIPYLDGNIYDDFGSTARKSPGDPTPAMDQWTLYNVSSSSSEWTNRIDNSVLFTTATNTVGFSSSPVIGEGISGYSYTGDIAEVIVYNRVLNSVERAAIVTYINSKYSFGF